MAAITAAAEAIPQRRRIHSAPTRSTFAASRSRPGCPDAARPGRCCARTQGVRRPGPWCSRSCWCSCSSTSSPRSARASAAVVGPGPPAFATVLVPGRGRHLHHVPGHPGRGHAARPPSSASPGRSRTGSRRPCPVWLVAVAKVLSGAVQGVIAALIVFPIAAVVHAKGVAGPPDGPLVGRHHHHPAGLHRHDVARPAPRQHVRAPQHRAHVRLRRPADHVPRRHLLPVDAAGPGQDRRVPLAADRGAGQSRSSTWPEGLRAALTDASHMHLYVVYPVLIGFCALFLSLGIRAFRKRVLS